MSLDVWSGVHCVEQGVDRPSWDQVQAAIDALDARRHTLLTLDGGERSTLMIGGGEGRYVGIYQLGEDEFWSLRSDQPADGEPILLNCGGQEGDFRPDQILGVDQVRAAAKTFFDTGGLDAALGWRRQD